MVPALLILSAFLQVYSRISAPDAREKKTGMVPDRIVLVQIERRVSLLVLYYSNLHTQIPEWARVRVSVCVGVIARMVKAIRRCRRNAENAVNERRRATL
jgi:hypothetical protein